MIKAAKVALCLALTMPVATITSSDAVFAAGRRAVAAGEGEVRQLLALMDTDQNGQVSRDEFMRFMEGEFDSLDIDRSGELNPRELSYSRIGVRGGNQVVQLLRLMDKDRNGNVSHAEFMNFMAAEFNRLDVDRSGELTPAELSHTILRMNPTHVSPHK